MLRDLIYSIYNIFIYYLPIIIFIDLLIGNIFLILNNYFFKNYHGWSVCIQVVFIITSHYLSYYSPNWAVFLIFINCFWACWLFYNLRNDSRLTLDLKSISAFIYIFLKFTIIIAYNADYISDFLIDLPST